MNNSYTWLLASLSGLMLSITTIFITGPATIYAANSDQFVPSPIQIFSVYLPYIVGIVITLSIFFTLLPLVLKRLLACFLIASGVALWLQSTFFLYDFGPLDGQNWQIDAGTGRVLAEGGTLLFGALSLGALTWVYPSFLTRALIILTIVSIGRDAYVLPEKPDKESSDLSSLFSFSGEKNLLVVLLDGLRSETFEEVIRKHGDILSSFDGFTYFPDNSGVGYSTVLSLPAIHTGIPYKSGTPVKDYFDIIKDKSFMNLFSDDGYNTSLINPMYGVCPSDVELCSVTNTMLVSLDDAVLEEADRLLAMSVFRAVPFSLKQLVYNDGKWIRLVSNADPRIAHFSVEGNFAIQLFGDLAMKNSSQPTAKFLHLFSTHLPVALDENCKYIGDQKSSHAGYTNQARCALEAVSHMLGKLKEIGVYDRTAIVLLSDHGSGGWPSSRAISTGEVRSYLLAVANPTLVVKAIGARGPMKHSDEPKSLADIPSIVCALTNDCVLPKASGPDRQYLHYTWDGETWTKNSPVEVTVYTISGPVFDGRTWRKEAIAGRPN